MTDAGTKGLVSLVVAITAERRRIADAVTSGLVPSETTAAGNADVADTVAGLV